MEKNTSIQWESLYLELKEQLIIVKEENADTVNAAQKAITLCTNYILDLKAKVKGLSFTSKQEEINLFKIHKPKFYSLFLFHTKIFNLETKKPIGGQLFVEEYYLKQLAKLKSFFDDHIEIYQYYRSHASNRDEQFFLRNNDQNILRFNSPDADPAFSTEHDYTFAKIIAYEMLADYLLTSLKSLKETASGNIKLESKDKKLVWTASKIAFIELIYAFKAGAVFNNGTATIKMIHSELGSFLGVEVSNSSRGAQELLSREKGLTDFLDFLKGKLQGWSDDLHDS
jgi:hypothetical protein